MILKNGPGRRSLIGLREYRFDTAKPRQLASAQITRMSKNTPSPSGGAVPPKPAEASKVQPKQATVRIALPPKPAGGATIRLPTAAPAPAAPAPASAGATVRLPTAAPASSSAPAAPRPPAPSATPASVSRPAPAPTKTVSPVAPALQNKQSRPASSTVSGVDKALSVVAMIATLAALGVVAYLVWGLPTTLN